MRTISQDFIKECTANDAVYHRGYGLFTDECVQKIKIINTSKERCEISAKVIGSQGRVYQTNAAVSFHDHSEEIEQAFCECQAFASYGGLCKHLAALLFEYNYQVEDDEFNEYSRFNEDSRYFEDSQKQPDIQQPEYQIQKSSDRELKNLMDYYVLQDRNQFCQQYGSGDVRLVPILHLESDRESLELKIGTTQMYVVKDIGELVADIKQMRFVSYGKKLAFTHNQSAFTREAAEIVNLLLEMDNESEFSYRYQAWRYSSSQAKRSCTLSPRMLDRLMELYEGKKLRVEIGRAHV